MVKHFLSLMDWSTSDLEELLDKATFLKREHFSIGHPPVMRGKTLALVFQKPSLRTRVSFEIAIQQLGGHALYLCKDDVDMGDRESIADVVRVLGEYVHSIAARVSDHNNLLEMATWSPVPVINALTKHNHPCQAMADVLTIQEELGQLAGLKVVYLGSSNQDTARSLLFAAVKFGFQLILSSPEGFWMEAETLDMARAIAGEQVVQCVSNPTEAVQEVDVIYTDSWEGMGMWEKVSDAEATRRLQLFSPYQVNESLMAHAPKALIMHCMPANRGQEISDAAADGIRSRLLQQAQNRVHVQKAILLHLVGCAAA
jgi:ornithine carbamoyltransferase